MRSEEKDQLERAGAGKPPRVKKEKPPRMKKEKKAREKKQKIPGQFKASAGDFFRNRMVIGFIIMIVCLLIAFVGFPIVRGIVSERVPVVVAAVNIERGTYLMAEHFKIVEIGAVDRPKNAAETIEQAIGAYAGMDLLMDDLIVSTKLTKEIPLTNPYLYDMPDGKVALSVSVKGLAEGLTGKLKSGDIVSVYAVFNKSDAEENYIAVQPPELKYVQVLAVSNASGTDIDVDVQVTSEDGSDTEKLPSTITLQVGDFQAAALAGLDRNATIHVGLVARADDTELCKTLLEVQDEYIASLEEEEDEGEEETVAEEGIEAEESSTDTETSGAEEKPAEPTATTPTSTTEASKPPTTAETTTPAKEVVPNG